MGTGACTNRAEPVQGPRCLSSANHSKLHACYYDAIRVHAGAAHAEFQLVASTGPSIQGDGESQGSDDGRDNADSVLRLANFDKQAHTLEYGQTQLVRQTGLPSN